MRYITRLMKHKGSIQKADLFKYMPALTKDLNQYRSKFKKTFRTPHEGISDYFIIYPEDELIPNQIFDIGRVRNPGIHDWKDALHYSKYPKNETSDYLGFEPNHLFRSYQ